MKDRRNRWESCLHMILPGELRTKKSCPHARKKAGKYYVEKGKCEGCTYWEAWECVPERTVQEIITKDCKKCQYGSRNSDGARMTCDYIGDMGTEGHANRETAGKQEFLSPGRVSGENS